MWSGRSTRQMKSCGPVEPAELRAAALDRREFRHAGRGLVPAGGLVGLEGGRLHEMSVAWSRCGRSYFVVVKSITLGYRSLTAWNFATLRYFVTAAGGLNISRASSRLRISQPAVSRQIHDLEDELGVELFVRESGGLRLTPRARPSCLRRATSCAGVARRWTACKAFAIPAPVKIVVGSSPRCSPGW